MQSLSFSLKNFFWSSKKFMPVVKHRFVIAWPDVVMLQYVEDVGED